MWTPSSLSSVVFYYRKAGLARMPNTYVVALVAEDDAG
jgi:hypothetical protein